MQDNATQQGYTINTPPLTQKTIAAVGFIIMGGILISITDFAPKFAVGTASVLLLGVLLHKANDITGLATEFLSAVGQTSGGN